MNKLHNLSLALLVLILSGSPGCERYSTYQEHMSMGPDVTDNMYFAQTDLPMVEAPLRSAPVVAKRPAPIAPMPVVAGGLGQIVISRIYPAPEFAVVQMEKTVPEEVEINKPFDYSISVRNLTNATLTDVVVTEELPKNFKYTSSEPMAKENMTNLEWAIESLGPKESRHITVTGLAIDDDYLQVSTTVVTNFIPISANIKVIQPKLELAVEAPSGAILRDVIRAKYTVSNPGTGSARNIKVVTTLPGGLQRADGKGELEFDVGTLDTGQSRRYLVKLRAVQSGRYVIESAATGTGLRSKSQENTIVVGQPVLVINKTGPEKQYAGKPVLYEIKIANKGDAPAKNVIIEDEIPRGVTSVKATAGAKLTRARKVVWKLGTLAPDVSKKVRLSYVPTEMGTLTNKTTATAYCAEVATSSVTTSVAGISGVLLEVVDLEDPIELGGSTTYVVKVENQGSAPATGIRIICNLEDNVRYISSTGATRGLLEGNVLTFTPLDSLAPKAKATWNIIVQAMEPADTRFNAVMNTDQLTRPVEETEATHLYK